MEASFEAMAEGLDNEERQQLKAAVQTVIMDALKGLSVPPDKALKDRLHGKTAAEIIVEAQTIYERREREKISEGCDPVQAEIAYLEKKKQEAEAAKETLKRFEIKHSTFFFTDGNPRIELTVSNGLDWAVSRAHFHGIITTPDRTIP